MGEREWQKGESGVHDLPKGLKSPRSRYPTKEIEENVASKVHSHQIGTPTVKSERRRSIGEFWIFEEQCWTILSDLSLFFLLEFLLR